MANIERIAELTEMYFFDKTTTEKILKELTTPYERDTFKAILRSRAIYTANALCDVLDEAAQREVESWRNQPFGLSDSPRDQ